jgi:hypothetical protein
MPLLVLLLPSDLFFFGELKGMYNAFDAFI